eukprot:2051111-Pleurochrysis_carterae.AAC.3
MGAGEECTKSRRACAQASEMGCTSSGPVVASSGKPARYSRTAGRLTAWGNARRKHLTMSGSYSAEDTKGSPVGTRISQICRRLSLASRRINASASTSSTTSRIRFPRRRSSSLLCRTAAMRRRPARWFQRRPKYHWS